MKKIYCDICGEAVTQGPSSETGISSDWVKLIFGTVRTTSTVTDESFDLCEKCSILLRDAINDGRMKAIVELVLSEEYPNFD